jgi:hypothetical protein
MTRRSRKTPRSSRRLPVWYVSLLCLLSIGGCIVWSAEHGLADAAHLTPLESTQALPAYHADRPPVPAVAFTVQRDDKNTAATAVQKEMQEQDYRELTASVGNTYGNLCNAGYAVTHQDSLFYISPTGIYHESLTSGKVRHITDMDGSFLNAGSDWLYYLDQDGYICKVTTDGKTGWQLTGQAACYLVLAGDWLYYIEAEETRCLYRIRVDGTGRQRLTDCTVLQVCPYNGWLYCTGFSDLFRIRPDGTGMEELLDKRFVYLQPRGNTVYAVRGDTQYGGTMVSIDLYMLEINPISEDTARCMMVDGDTIYYRNESKVGYLFAIQTNGENNHEVDVKTMDGISLAGNWFFYKRDGSPTLCRMCRDGSGAEDLP